MTRFKSNPGPRNPHLPYPEFARSAFTLNPKDPWKGGRMPYDESLDECLGEHVVSVTNFGSLIVSIHSYGGGQVKAQLRRTYIDKRTGEEKFSKLGRMTIEELTQAAGYAAALYKEWIVKQTTPAETAPESEITDSDIPF